MMLAQMLYEGVPLKDGNTVGLITYMRTDSTRVSAEAQDAALAHIRQAYGDELHLQSPTSTRGVKRARTRTRQFAPPILRIRRTVSSNT